MPTKRPNEPIAPTTIPGQPLDPRIPPDQRADDDDVGTDERGNEMLSARLSPTAPDVSSDRAVADGDSRAAIDRKKNSPLEIQEIENLEDDAKGG
jgi:hypothetical protein